MRDQKANPGAKYVVTRKLGTRSVSGAQPELPKIGGAKATVKPRTDHFGPALGCDVTLPPVPKPSQAGRF